MTWHTGTLCALSVKATRPDAEKARIVGACVMRVDGSGRSPAGEVMNTWPDDAPAEEVVSETIALLAKDLREGVPVVGFDVVGALTVLDRESRRHGMPTVSDLLDSRVAPVICAQVLDGFATRRPDRDTFAGCCKRWDVRLKDPDDPAWCAWAAAGLVVRIARRHKQVGLVDLAVLHARQGEWRREQSRSYAGYLRRQAAAARTADEQLDLHALAGRAEAEAEHWPVVPFEQQGTLA